MASNDQGTVMKPSCRFTLPVFFFLLAFAVPLSAWAGCMNVTSPITGDSWNTTQTYTIRWNTTSKPTVHIHLQKNGKRQSTITSSAPNNGSYSWTIPSDTLINKLDEGKQYYLAICTDDCCGDGEYFSL
ncbi:MAG: hypothetical protein D3908_16285, partial [Candidatus Electrothrix sp. AUS4]|nr:hypothetical protein [Candidatus Electrothrix sp. AUS4]